MKGFETVMGVERKMPNCPPDIISGAPTVAVLSRLVIEMWRGFITLFRVYCPDVFKAGSPEQIGIRGDERHTRL